MKRTRFDGKKDAGKNPSKKGAATKSPLRNRVWSCKRTGTKEWMFVWVFEGGLQGKKTQVVKRLGGQKGVGDIDQVRRVPWISPTPGEKKKGWGGTTKKKRFLGGALSCTSLEGVSFVSTGGRKNSKQGGKLKKGGQKKPRISVLS